METMSISDYWCMICQIVYPAMCFVGPSLNQSIEDLNTYRTRLCQPKTEQDSTFRNKILNILGISISLEKIQNKTCYGDSQLNSLEQAIIVDIASDVINRFKLDKPKLLECKPNRILPPIKSETQQKTTGSCGVAYFIEVPIDREQYEQTRI